MLFKGPLINVHVLSARARTTRKEVVSSKWPPAFRPSNSRLDRLNDSSYSFMTPCRKHYLNHLKHVLCDFATCPRGQPGKGFATSKDMHQHCWVAHPAHAREKNYPDPRGVCDLCGQVLRRKDNIRRHQENSCQARKRNLAPRRLRDASK